MATNIATAVWPLYFVLALGFLAGKRGGFPADAAKELNKLAMSYALPATLFVSTATLSRGVLTQDLPALAAVLVSYLSIFVLTVVIVHRGFKRTLPEAAIAGICAASPAGPLFGPAVLPALFGPGGLIAVTIAALVLNLTQNPAALALIGGENGKGSAQPPSQTKLAKVLAATKGVVKQPVVWAPLLGLAFVLLGIPVSKIFTAGFQLIGSTSAGVAIFATGLTLASSGFQLSREVIMESAIKMIGLPATVLGVGLLFGVRGPLLAECVITGALSSGLLAMMISSTRGIYTKQAGSTTMLTSGSLVIFLPLWIFITKLIVK